ncbi:flavodoxin family protein [Thermodesulforhabdus norvegica]|uniref:Multimeric flavodoxin WrbA n=1 Tax=Thermodesulforhabdus norvegica TaxID=39841 RepID=A0A1I4R717_9BACT|nr:flavodoxin family protein [Thermodesulforhabdus norvegica]SFM48057.1 Multimeric flavodoxin WrbA [Thermodesulforhabdus norvegica]
MPSLLGIVCSPRTPSNGELFIKAVHKELGNDWQLYIIRLVEWNIGPCRACYRCLFDGCPQKDDMSQLIRHIASADAVMITAPTYFLGASATLKKFVDRGLMFYAHLDELWGKPMLAVVTAGIRHMDGYALLMAESAVKIMGGNLLGSFVIYGAFPGEGVIGEENRAKITEAAKAIATGNPLAQSNGPECPLCGGRSFRFLDKSTIQCLLCSNTGSFRLSDGEMLPEINPSKHQLFLSLEAAKEHAEWLRGMKKRFLEVRDSLKPVVRALAGRGTTITPPSKSRS